ncbi:MAG: RagB/SusD family nutrient uptake outer membrane protein [Flavobacteriaceae bacterium]|nr:RagB/SusD family nutrient uptake outer membrane protein [Flavobacteriaceae bacterium]
MKRYKIIMTLLLVFIMGCDDEFLDKKPESSITLANFLNTKQEFELFANQWYAYFPKPSGQVRSAMWNWDDETDNQLPRNLNLFSSGGLTINSAPPGFDGGGWSFAGIRSVNIALGALDDATDLSENEKKVIEGEMRFFKAYLYYDKVRRFGDVPWLEQEINESDIEELYQPRDSRVLVVNNIIQELDVAIAQLPERNGGRIHKYAALALKARICLFEGTFEKYHNVSGGNPNQLLQLAADTAHEIIENGPYALHTVGGKTAYKDYFSLQDKSTSKETIFDIGYSADEGLFNWSTIYLSTESRTGLSKELADDYLDINGDPIALSQLFDPATDYHSLETEVAHRDPRFAQTVMLPGDVIFNDSASEIVTVPRLDQDFPTGYNIHKFVVKDVGNPIQNRQGEDSFPLFRLGEIYLIYAEALAELGTISQSDVDQSINRLRDRAGMPHMVLADLVRDPDSDFDGSFPPIDAVSVTIDEIRRERRVELACEGFRKDDLMRWKAGALMTKPVIGAKLNESWHPNALTTGVLVNADNFILPTYHATPRVWDEGKNYLYPIPPSQIGLYENGELTQNPGWQ